MPPLEVIRCRRALERPDRGTYLSMRQSPTRNSRIRSLTRYQRIWDRKFCTGVLFPPGVLVLAGIPFVRIEEADEGRILMLSDGHRLGDAGSSLPQTSRSPCSKNRYLLVRPLAKSPFIGYFEMFLQICRNNRCPSVRATDY